MVGTIKTNYKLTKVNVSITYTNNSKETFEIFPYYVPRNIESRLSLYYDPTMDKVNQAISSKASTISNIKITVVKLGPNVDDSGVAVVGFAKNATEMSDTIFNGTDIKVFDWTYASGISLEKGINTSYNLSVNSTQQLKASVTNSSVATSTIIKWYSNNPSVATVDSDTGLVRAISSGKATISAKTLDGVSLEKNITINVK